MRDRNHGSYGVCLVAPVLPPAFSGAGIRVSRYVHRLDRMGKLSFVITHRLNASWAEGAGKEENPRNSRDFREDKILELPFSSGGNLGMAGRFCAVPTFIAGILLYLARRRARRQGTFGIVHCFSACMISFSAVLVAKLLGKKSILEMTLLGVDDPHFIMAGDRPRIKAHLKRWLLKRVDIVVTISPALTSAYEKAGLPVAKVREVPNPVDTSLYCPVDCSTRTRIRSALSIPSDCYPVVLFVGSITKRKGVDLVFQTFRRVAAGYEKPVLLLVGPNSDDREQVELTGLIRKEAREAGLAGNVLFTGRVNNVEDYMKASDIFLFPSRNEGFGTVLVEAMATGLPVVALKIPGVTDYIVQDGKDGFIVEGEDPSCFSEVIMGLLADRNLYREISRCARQTALERFSNDVIDQKYARIYEELLA